MRGRVSQLLQPKTRAIAADFRESVNQIAIAAATISRL
jgi:hypothetical protein